MNRRPRHHLTVTVGQASPKPPSDPLKAAESALQHGDPVRAAKLLHEARVEGQGVVPGLHLLAIAMAQLQRFDEAESLWRRLLTVPGQEKAVLSNLGRMLDKAGRSEEALSLLSRAVELSPDDYFAQLNLGACLHTTGHYARSREHCLMAARLRPDLAQPHFNLGCAWEAELDFEQARTSYDKALAIDPAHQEATRNRLFLEHFLPELTPAQRLAHAIERADALCRTVTRLPLPRQRRPGPLRVGLLSADFRTHPVGWFLSGFLRHIDPAMLQLHAFNNGPKSDDMTAHLRTAFPVWNDIVGQGDAAVAEAIAAQGIDILIELSGMTAGNGLGVLARKPAPIQISWLGYFSSTGLPTIDWVLADPLCVPPGEEVFFRERVWRLPHSRFCMAPPADAPEPNPLPALSQGFVTLASFQELAKLNDRVLALWSQVINPLPGARLRVQSARLAKREERKRFLRRLAAAGIAADRCELLPPATRAGYLRAHHDVDFILDSFPYTGGTTTSEALWMGVPTLTLASPGMLERQGEAHLRNVGLDDWVTHSERDYVARALFHASPQGLRALAATRRALRERCRVSPLFDNQRFARDWTQALLAIQAQHLSSQ
ncbi:MAG: tetratricopeptide repeat protein [Hydrogenophaga sp.]|nr:tetratricopeptide repeat protein [Hydrogenophaga sp.]